MRKLFILLSFCIWLSPKINAQNSIWKSGIELGTGLSTVGYSVTLCYEGIWNNHSIIVGPLQVYSDANQLFDAPWGWRIGYRHSFSIKEKITAFAEFSNQSAFYTIKNQNLEANNRLVEFHLSYGWQYRFYNNFKIGNSLGLGGFIEHLEDPVDNRIDKIRGFSPLLRIFITYEL